MSMRASTTFLLTITCTTLCFIAGCERGSQDEPVTVADSPAASGAGTDDYDPHDVPISEEQIAELKKETAQFGTAVATIKALRDTIEKETKGGIPQNPYVAHQALDKADLVLKWLPQAASDSGVAKEHWEEINTSANDLRTLLEKVHQRIDQKQDPDFSSVTQQMDQEISQLENVASGGNATDQKN